jgi:starch synthase (maltosyl-transferring)
MRPNFWPNTPDINPFHLQHANESQHIQRYVLAATLSSNTGVYGPVYEQMISEPIVGREEYLHSEKFQIAHYDWTKENWVTNIIGKVNKVRQAQTALQQTNNIKFCHVDNDKLIAFYKWDENKTNEVLVVINLDAYNMQQGMLQLPLSDLGVWHGHHIKVTDLITDYTYDWNEEWNFVRLHPAMPFHIFKISK